MTDFMILLFGVTMLYAASSTRIESYIKAIAAQGVLLFLLVLADFSGLKGPDLIFLSVETILFKALLVPWFLTRTVRKNGIFREVEPSIPNFYALAAAGVIYAAGLFLSYGLMREGAGFRPIYFGMAASVIATGLFFIMTRKKIITHVMGYVMMENGIFLLSLSVVKEMPFIVNMGVLLDLFAAIFILGLFASKINDAFDEMDVESLSELKD